MAQKIKGKCKYCAKEYTYSYMSRHLAACKERCAAEAGAGAKKSGYYELAIYPRYGRSTGFCRDQREGNTGGPLLFFCAIYGLSAVGI